MAKTYADALASSFFLEYKKYEDFVANAVVEYIGGTCQHGTRDDDRLRHIDLFWTTPKGVTCSIDVKGPRKNKRGDSENSKEVTWLELQNVKGGNGSLRGEADYIAFVHEDRIVFVNRERLLSFVEQKTLGVDIVYDTPKECYVPYKRSKWGRDDVVVKAYISDVDSISDWTILLECSHS